MKRGFGDGHITGTMAWLILMTNAIVTSMVAVSFGSYASEAVGDQTEGAVKLFAVLIVIVMSAMNVLGSQAVARVQTVIVYVVLTMLTIFAVSTLANLDPDLLAFSTYPSFGDIVASVALTFFAFLGFGVITFTAAELRDPARQLSRAMYLASGDRHHDLRRRRPRRVRDVDGRRGDRVGWHRARRRRRADPRTRRLLDDDRHGTVLDLRCHERRVVPRGRDCASRWPTPASSRPPWAGRWRVGFRPGW